MDKDVESLLVMKGGDCLMKLITVQRAKNEIRRLKEYVTLVESYEADSLDKWIIKEYAYTNSAIEIVRRANARNFITDNGCPIDRKYVISVISRKSNDELHRILRQGYKLKIRPNKRSIYQ